ncbi:MAG: F0F1 ATP synthase subunit epsilon [Pseudomonadota bacterium]|nr:F0F1 ATP synthase subunit epsilon [Pseudomonadota bacterium]
MMKLKIVLPSRVLIDEEAGKIVAEAQNGSFCLRPRHIDFVTALVPGLLFFVNHDDREIFLAVDEGVLVKCGRQVLVSSRRAVQGTDLGTLTRLVQDEFLTLDDREKMVRSAISKIEADFIRSFLEIQKHG